MALRDWFTKKKPDATGHRRAAIPHLHHGRPVGSLSVRPRRLSTADVAQRKSPQLYRITNFVASSVQSVPWFCEADPDAKAVRAGAARQDQGDQRSAEIPQRHLHQPAAAVLDRAEPDAVRPRPFQGRRRHRPASPTASIRSPPSTSAACSTAAAPSTSTSTASAISRPRCPSRRRRAAEKRRRTSPTPPRSRSRASPAWSSTTRRRRRSRA